MTVNEHLENIWRRSAPFSRAIAYFASLAVAGTFLYLIAQHSPAYLGLFDDDHFYYTVVADNFLSSGRLTYDGQTLTNGFHPLWFCVVLLLRIFAGGLGSAFYIALTAVSLSCMLATYELSRRYATLLGASVPFAAAIAALYSLATARLLSNGMECVIAVPLFTWWLVEIAKPVAITLRRATYLGFVSSLAILARLDIAIAVALAIAAHLLFARTPWRRRAAQITLFGLGGALLPVYVAANLWFFATPLPVSALAKRLTTAWGFNLYYPYDVATQTIFGPSVALLLPLGGLAAWLMYRRRHRSLSPAFVSGAVALLFAAIFFFINSLTGWIVFGWYLYPLPVALLVALAFVGQWWRPAGMPRSLAIALMLLSIASLPLRAGIYFWQHGPRWTLADNSLMAMSYQLAERTKHYKGLFAMGAVAGMARVTMDRPLLQIEGIMSDGRMVQHLRNQDRLGDVLREYHADYLVATYASQPAVTDGCVFVSQPDAQWAGKRTAKMRGWVCGTPKEHFFTEAGIHSYSQFPRMETFVWNLHDVNWKDSPDERPYNIVP